MQLYTAAQTRELDRVAIEEHGIAGIRLMGRAGKAALETLLEEWPAPERLSVFCGTGNNGGDGCVVAELALSRNIPVVVYQIGEPAKITGDAQLARQRALAAGVEIRPFSPVADLAAGVIVDGLLGTGLSGDVRPEYVEAINLINNSGLPVLALDVPSGLCSDTGSSLGATVRADRSVTFIGFKRGLLTGAAPDYCGTIHYTDLDVPPETFAAVNSQAWLLQLDEQLPGLSRRLKTAHKGRYGKVLVVGGDHGMGGAAVMAAEAAGRCGAGLISAATRAEHIAAFIARRPEVMAHCVASGQELLPLLESSTVVAIGPGLGNSTWSEQLLYAALESGKPLVLDADGLNLLAAGSPGQHKRRDNWVLTPHPGEAARLLQADIRTVQADRFAAVMELQSRYGGVILLKGAGTLIAAEDGSVCVSNYGNPGMASGGMGDVLTGVIAGLLAQRLTLVQATRLAACLHGRAAELAAEQGERGMLAADLMPRLRELLG